MVIITLTKNSSKTIAKTIKSIEEQTLKNILWIVIDENSNDTTLELVEKSKINKEIIKVDSYYYRPTEVNMLLGDASKAREKLNWQPEISFDELVSEMMLEDIYLAKQNDSFKAAGERIFKS